MTNIFMGCSCKYCTDIRSGFCPDLPEQHICNCEFCKSINYAREPEQEIRPKRPTRNRLESFKKGVEAERRRILSLLPDKIKQGANLNFSAGSYNQAIEDIRKIIESKNKIK